MASKILFKDKSNYTGKEVVSTITYTSTNIKTGNIPQITFLPVASKPTDAIKNGEDESVCGNCRLRPINHKDTPMEDKPCYVNCGYGPNAIHKTLDKIEIHKVKTGQYEIGRIGAWGGCDSIPKDSVLKIRSMFKKVLNYTHDWENEKSNYLKAFTMASVHNLKDKIKANKLGFRTFRTVKNGDVKIEKDEIYCPNFTKGIQCKACGLCGGSEIKAKNIVIPIH